MADALRSAGTAARSDDLIEIAKTAIGAEVGLSAAQSRRLVGNSAEELRRDARDMARENGLDVGGERGQHRDARGHFSSINQLIREASGRMS